MQYTQAQIDRANAVSLEDFLRTQGETLIKSGREYRWKEHDSLTVRGNKWFRHSQSKGGYPIDFVMEFYGKSFPEAVQLLTGESGEGQTEASTAPPTAFHLPLHNRTADRAIQYLCESRGLNPKLVEAFLLSGDIYEDAKRHNVVFVGRDRSGTPRYAHVRGTADPFRQDIAGSDKSYPFRYEGNGNQLFVFEAPIDLLSFICLYPQDWQKRNYLALGGVSGKALDRFLSERKDTQKVFLCLDSDTAGSEACTRLAQDIPGEIAVIRLVPARKDWNDVLRQQGDIPSRKFIAETITLRELPTAQPVPMLRMADVELTSVDWLWFPYIPFGKLTIIQGNPGEGKTYFAMRLAAACTNRKPLPGMETLEPFNIIYQTAEDGLGDTVKPRLMEAEADLERVLVIDDRDTPLTLADERIARAIRENNARLVIIDPVQAFLGADVDMNRANEVRPIFRSLGDIAQATGCAIVLIGHLNKAAGTQSTYRGLHEDGENTAHFVDSFGFTELPKFMLTLEGKENEIETELAVHIADRYILMHECEEGYDYSILDEQYHLLDGGVYDNPDITIRRAMDMVIADLKEPRFSAVTEQYYRDEFLQGEVYAGSEAEIVDFEELSEKAEEVEQADLEAKQAEFRENNPDVVADFRARTEELFHSLDGQSAEDIEKTVYAYVQSQIDEYGLDAEIVDVVVSGSRCRGIEKENSDLDVVVEYTGSTREDDLFNMLHEDSIYIAGIQVDINPITEGKTGTLETYLPEVETYLQEKAQQEQINNQLVTQGREVVQEQNTLASEGKVLSELEKEPVIEPETVHITFTVAECGEIHSMGEFHEGIETVEEAMKLYNAIDPSRMQGIPSIGVNMHIEGTEEWEDEQADIVSGKRIDVDFLNYTPELRDTPKVQDAIKKLIAAYPEKDVIDMETKEQKIQTLAAELDQLSYDIDTFEYRDSVPDREAQIQMIANDIRSGNVKPLQIFLQTSIDEGIDEDSERQAKELIAKLAEYKPLAKIEELEEQNYNMIDDRLNNGVEKFNREEEKKEQAEKPQARTSLKERLAAKQTEVAQGKKDSKEQEKSKNTHREM